MIWGYLSINLFLTLPLAVLNIAQIHRFARAVALATVAAALAHLLLPRNWAGCNRPASTWITRTTWYRRSTLRTRFLRGAVVWNGATAHWLRILSGAWLALLVSSVLLVASASSAGCGDRSRVGHLLLSLVQQVITPRVESLLFSQDAAAPFNSRFDRSTITPQAEQQTAISLG